ncbi:SusC/RagA family TonB-linked outer membrane protein [uncultured Alistipes sp.]|uniref:SusC/RagA family TonB-linked outer membrane protein n=1 Tax=uncultured Alistipes sp. TaxID=538949 RepID=UPI00262BAC4E|nr:SusC/RagA family TonB-linked outer membrane protein [uncultured Alistipes sp.]
MKNLYANECSARLRTQAASGIARRAALAALAAALLPALPATAGEGGATPPRGTEATAQAAPARRVTCRVLDDKGNPVVGAAVAVVGSTRGAVTDAEGVATLEGVKEGDRLTASCLGMLSQTIDAGSRTEVGFTLAEDAIGLEDVVVTGYTSMKRKDITGSVASISSEQIARIPAYDITTSLVGVAGIRMDGGAIRIRGTRSRNASNDPLIILDGIPYDETLSSINPGDIETIDVLKDASSTAIYGARGANGVILITTKRAKEGRATVTYDGFAGVGVNNWGSLEVMNADEYVAFQREASRAVGAWHSEEDDAKAFFGAEQANIGKMDNDWMGRYFEKKRLWTSHSLTISAATEKTSYKIAFNYKNEDSRYKNAGNDHFFLTTDLTHQVLPFLKVGVSNRAYYIVRNAKPDMFNQFLHMSPLTPTYEEDGSLNTYPFGDPFVKNPYLNESDEVYKDKTEEWKLFMRMFAQVDLAKGLTFNTNFAYSPAFSARGYYYDNRSVSYTDDRNVAYTHNNRKADWVWNNVVNFKRTFGKHNVDLTAVYEMQNRQTVNSSMQGRDQESPAYLWYNMGRLTDSKQLATGFVRNQMVSVVGRVQYSYDDRYIVTASFREDGASQLSKGHKWAFFPSVAAAWRISEEAFLKDVEWLTNLKLRATYGMTGNYSIAPYATAGTLYGTYANFNGGELHRPGLEPSTRPTPDLKWERNKMLDIGLDFGFLRGRIHGTVEYYDSKSYDLLYLKVLPYTSGFNRAWSNVGDTRNRGWEVSLQTVPVETKDFHLGVNLSYYRNKEELVRLQDPTMKEDINNGLFVGYPVNGVHYNYKQLGIWQQDEAELAALYGQKPGEVKVADLDGNGKIDGNDRMILGTTRPDWVGGLQINGNWKNLDFSVDVYGEFGALAYDSRSTSGWASELGRWNTYKIDYWTPENPSNRHPRPTEGQSIRYLDATGYYKNSYVNIRNITVGYTLPRKWMGRVVKKTRFYVTMNMPWRYSRFQSDGGITWWESFYIFGANVQF